MDYRNLLLKVATIADRRDGTIGLVFIAICVVAAIAMPPPYRWALIVLGCIEALRLLARSR